MGRIKDIRKQKDDIEAQMALIEKQLLRVRQDKPLPNNDISEQISGSAQLNKSGATSLALNN